MNLLSLSVLRHILFSFREVFTAPAFALCIELATAALLNRGRQTICGMLRALPFGISKHFTCYHRFFNRARWSMMEAGKILFRLVLMHLPQDQPFLIAADSTLTRRRGNHVFARGLYYDPVRSSKKIKVLSQGHEWVVLSILTKLPEIVRRWALPVLSFLVIPEKMNATENKKKTKQSKVIKVTKKREPQPKHRKPAELLLIGMRLLRSWAPPPHTGKRGRPPIKGRRLPSPLEAAKNPSAKWLKATIAWYGSQTEKVELLTGAALWYHPGQGVVPIRWVVVRHQDSRLECFYSTDQTMTATQIVGYYIGRWSIEVTFEETRKHLHLEQNEVWAEQSVKHLVPSLFALFTMTVLWFKEQAETGIVKVHDDPWYHKEEITYADVIASLREEQLKRLFFSQPQKLQGFIKNRGTFLKALIRLASQAA